MRIVKQAMSDTCVPRGTKATIDTKKDFVFQILNWEAVDEGPLQLPEGNEDEDKPMKRWFDEERKHTIYMTGSTKMGNSVSLKTTVEPSFLLKLMSADGRKWTERDIQKFINEDVISQWKNSGSKRKYDDNDEEEAPTQILKPRYYRVFTDPDNPNKDEREESAVYLSYTSAYKGCEEVWLKDLDAGFTGIEPIKYQYLRLKFTTLAAMQKCSNRMRTPDLTSSLAKRGKSVGLYEANVPPVIRFMHMTKVEAAGWCRVPANRYNIITENRKTKTQVEIELPNWKLLAPVQKEEIARFRQASVDIETYSPDDAKFSTAEVIDNYIIQIATYFSDVGSSEQPWKYIYTLKDTAPINQPYTKHVRFNTERELLIAWAKLIQNSDPDIIHAYNGWMFDYGYFAGRAMVTGCWEEFRQLLGRISR